MRGFGAQHPSQSLPLCHSVLEIEKVNTALPRLLSTWDPRAFSLNGKAEFILLLSVYFILAKEEVSHQAFSFPAAGLSGVLLPDR